MTDLSGIQSALAGAAQNLLGDLLGQGPNQHARLLRLHTPLGANVLLAERAQITEGIGPHPGQTNFGIDLLALSTNAHIQPVDVIGQPVLLELLTAQSLNSLRPFHGHVLAFELLGADGGYARYRLQVGSWLDFLRYRTDAWLFQDKSVVQITEDVFADYAAQGALQPQWRWDLKQADVYPLISTLSQHAESDFDFLQRLWAANGLFTWFEHTGDPSDDARLGSHTLVIADHNGALSPNAQNRIRYTQSGAALQEDSITQWHGHRRVGASMLNTASFDYRTVGNHSASAQTDAGHAQPMALIHSDQPGAYAFETPAEAARLAGVYQESLEAQRKQFTALSTVRTLAPATTFVLADHAEHDADVLLGHGDASQLTAQFAVLRVTHTARNNIHADAKAGLQHLLGDADCADSSDSKDSTEPLYQARFTAQRSHVAVRPALLAVKPTVLGAQTAVVVGLDGPIHTDRDGRVKVQLHWQHGDNAPAADASGTWVRVAQSWAGANWGKVFTPRLGQEVIVAFVEGDIDRPVVIGAAYNGQGTSDAQGNAIAAGAAKSTGNAPAWFPGSAAQGALQAHAHTATLSGFKSQCLSTSQGGSGEHNQLVLDDSAGQGRLLAHTTQSQTWLQMGHLLQQHDNQRLSPRGHGLELHTQAQGALRAASGLHINTHARQGGTSTGQGQPTNTREAQSQLRAHADLLKALSANAQTQLASLPNEPAPDKLRAQLAMQATLTSLGAVQCSAGGSGASSSGGHGSIPITDRPDIVLSAAADITSLTPAHTVITTGAHTTLTADQDINLHSQCHLALAVKDGISLFTRGEAKDSQRTVQDVGLKLHAASGNVNVQAQSDAFTLTAALGIDVQSTAGSVLISAPSKLLINGGGSYIKIDGANIELGTSGTAGFKASMKELGAGASASTGLPSFHRGELELPALAPLTRSLQVQLHDASGQRHAAVPYTVVVDKQVVAQGKTDASGQSQRIQHEQAFKSYDMWIGASGWSFAIEGKDVEPPAPLDDQRYEAFNAAEESL
ncbi:MAG: type VI secretion system Vgr family protein [Aquabacterium sp.]|nr:type VI secretion system Vgr family protein [Aquabacterium sp.]